MVLAAFGAIVILVLVLWVHELAPLSFTQAACLVILG